MKLTAELIHSASSHPRGDGFTKAQLAVLGISYPPKAGWLSSLVGKEIDEATFAKFKALGDERKAKRNLDHDAAARTRLSLDFDASSKARLEQLQARLGAGSMTDVIRRALTVLDVLTEDPKAKVQVTSHGQTETIKLL